MKPALPASLVAVLFAFCANAVAQGQKVAVPQIDGEWWQVAGNPDLGPLTSPKQEPVDFAVWPAADGSWQLWSCVRGTKEPGKTRLFHRWEGRAITDRDWKPMGIAMQADPARGETPGGLQAPYVFRPTPDGPFHMLYGDWVNICLATSDAADGKTFTRQPAPRGDHNRSGRFGEGDKANARDPFAIKIGPLWHVYYTAHPGNRGAVYLRRTGDFATFGKPRIVAAGGQAGSGPYSSECPHVVKREGYNYLFRTVHYKDKPLTHVYASRDALDFGVDDDRHHVGTLPVAAPEIVRHDGQDYILALTPALDGIRVAKLTWTPPAGN